MKTYSDFEFFLNSAEPAVVHEYIDKYPFSGVGCNPQMVALAGRTDYIDIVKDLRKECGDRKLFVQTPSNDYEGIMSDAHAILSIAGKPTLIKVPSTTGGIKAISDLTAEGIDVCATQVMSAMQGICALQAGAKYVAVFYSFMQMGGADEQGLYEGVDAEAAFKAICTFIKEQNCQGRIMCCAPRNANELAWLFGTGAKSIILDPSDFDNAFNSRHFKALNKNVHADWVKVFGEIGVADLLK